MAWNGRWDVLPMRSAVVDLGSQPIRNFSSDPRATRYIATPTANPAKSIGWMSNRYPGSTSFTLVTAATDGPPGTGITTYSRATTTTAATFGGLGHHLAENPEVSTPNAQFLVPVTGGEQFGLSVWVRTSIACQAVLRVRFAAGTTWMAGGPGTAAQPHTTVNLAANTWTRVVLTRAVPATATGMGSFLVVNDVLASGVTIDGTGQMLTRRDPHPPLFVDGNTPGWRWAGTAGASESVGYPYTLESIAGQPLIVNNTPGTNATTTATLSPLDARTLYVVGDVIDTTVGWPSWASLLNGPSTNGALAVQGGAAGSSIFQARVDTIGGSTNVNVSRSGGRTPGRHVIAASVNDGMTQASVSVDALATATGAVTPGSGMASPYLRLSPVAPTDAPVLALAYRGEHDETTRRRIMAWLARNYGAPVPAGY